MKNFAITGVAGYIAPRHLQAIKETNNNLVAAADPHDSVGILDKYFPQTSFFSEFERFDRHLEKLRRKGEDQRVNYITICSPNHLHDAHIRLALRIGADAICEKPLVLNPWNLDALQELESESSSRIYSVLQLRLHPSLTELKNKIETENKNSDYNVELTYITSRGLWYDYSWKGALEKSGGIATNIGIHFFDLLIYLFGPVEETTVHLSEKYRMAGHLKLKCANVKWFLSTSYSDLPAEALKNNKSTFRSIKVDGKEIFFTDGFTGLHTRIYQEVLKGSGFGIDDTRASVELVYNIRNAKAENQKGEVHPLAKKYLNIK